MDRLVIVSMRRASLDVAKACSAAAGAVVAEVACRSWTMVMVDLSETTLLEYSVMAAGLDQLCCLTLWDR